MKYKFMSLFLAAVLLLGTLSGCTKSPDNRIRLVLDYTPNTNHTGIYVALANGYYQQQGLELEILQPPEDGALLLLAAGDAHYAIDFQESMGPALAGTHPLPVQAIAAIVSHNTSGVLSLAKTGIQSPKDLAGKRFASWGTPLVDAIMREIVQRDGGDFSQITMLPDAVTDAVSALQADVDAIWGFAAWDGVAVEVAGLESSYFHLKDFSPVLDYYTPVLVTRNDYAAQHPDQVKIFLLATAKGYQFAIDNPDEAAEILLQQVPQLDPQLILQSQRYLSQQYQADAPQWGWIDAQRWGNFYDWMYQQGLLQQPIGTGGFTNEFLPAS